MLIMMFWQLFILQLHSDSWIGNNYPQVVFQYSVQRTGYLHQSPQAELNLVVALVKLVAVLVFHDYFWKYVFFEQL